MPVARRAVLAYLAAAQDAGVVDVEPADAAMALLQRAEHFPRTEPLLEGSEWAHSRASTTRATAEAAEHLNAAAGAAERASLTVCAWSCLLRDFVAAADMAEAWANDFTVQAEAQREGVDALAAAWDEATAQLRGIDRELEGIATGQLLQRGRALPGGADGGAGAGAGAGGKGSSRDSSRSRRISRDGDGDEEEDGDASGSDGEDGNVAFEAGDVVSTVLDLLHSPRPELTALTARRAECAKRRGAIEATGLALKVEARISTSLAALCRAIMDAIEATALDVLQALQGTLLRRAVAADAAAARAIASVVAAHEAEAARGDAADAAARALRARVADNDAFFRSGAAPVMRMTLQGQLGEEEAASRAAADAQLFLAVSMGRLGEYLATMPLELRETIGERLRRLLRASADAASHAIAAREGGFEYHTSSISTGYGRVGTAEAAAAAQASLLAAAFAKSGLRNRLASSLQQALRNSDSMRGASGTGAAAGAGAGAGTGAPGPLQHVRLLLEQALPAAQLAFDKTVSTGTGASSGAGGGGSGRLDGDLLAPVSAIRLPLAPSLSSRLSALAQALERGAAAAEPLSEESLPCTASALALAGGGGGSSSGGRGAGAAPSQSPVLLSLAMLSPTGASASVSSVHAAGTAASSSSSSSAAAAAAAAALSAASEVRACGLRPILLDDAVVTLRVLAASQAAWLGAAPGAGGAGAGAGGDDRSASASASASVDGFWRSALARLPSAADVLWAHDAADTCAPAHEPAPAASSASAPSAAGSGAGAAGGAGGGIGSRPHVLLTSCRSLFDAHALLGPYVPADFASYRRRRGGSGAGSIASGGASGSGSAGSSGGRVKSPAPGGAGAASSNRSHSSASAAEAAKPAKRSRRDEEEDEDGDDDDGSGSDGSEAAAAGGKGKGAEKSSGYCIIM